MKKIVRGVNKAKVTPLGGGDKPLGSGRARPLVSGGGSAGGRGVISAETYGAYNEAKEILSVAEAEAERIRQEAVRLRDEQVRQGFGEGHKKGYEEALGGLAALEARFDQLCANLEPQLIDLAVGIAKKIIGHELSSKPETIVEIVAQALRTIRHQREITVRVHPNHLAVVEQHKSELLGVLTRAPDIVVRADDDVPVGGCVIESELGRIEAELETQLEMLKRALTAAKGRRA